MKTKPIKILIADDHKLIRQALKLMLNSLQNFDFAIEESISGIETIEKFKTFDFDLLFLDISLPDISGIDICQHILSTDATKNIIAFTNNDEEFIINQAINSGVKGYLLKDITSEELIKAITEIHVKNNQYFSDEIVLKLSSINKLRNN